MRKYAKIYDYGVSFENVSNFILYLQKMYIKTNKYICIVYFYVLVPLF